MGRLNRTEENVQYTKLKDDQYADSCESSEQVMPGFEGYISFSCRHCGHLQIFQGTELEMILGKSLKMALRPTKKDQPSDNTIQSSIELQSNSDNLLSKNNIPMTVRSSYKSFQENLETTSIGIPVISAPFSHSQPTLRPTLSSDESNSPTQMNQFKRIVEKPSLMKRIGKGFVVSTSDEEGYPLVSDGSSSIPGSQTNISLLNVESTGSEMTKMRLVEGKQGGLSNVQNFQCGDSISSTEEAEPRSETDRKEGNLRMAPWYQEGIPREIALEILSQEPIGSFMVRRSTTKLGCFALSVRVPRSFQPRGIAHYLIMRTNKGYRIKGFTKDFPSLGSLIAHHSVMPELLPCPLSLSRYHPVCVISDCRRDFADIEPEPDG